MIQTQRRPGIFDGIVGGDLEQSTEKPSIDSIDSIICAYEFRMRMGERDSGVSDRR
jgi:hypothetical protein